MLLLVYVHSLMVPSLLIREIRQLAALEVRGKDILVLERFDHDLISIIKCSFGIDMIIEGRHFKTRLIN
jgi:hypothetical protein